MLFRPKNTVLGKGVRAHSSVEFNTEFGGSIQIGDNCEIGKYSMIVTYGGNIVIGNNCSINPFCMIYGHGGLTIGDNVRIATHTIIIPANHTFSDLSKLIMNQPEERLGVVINSDVWIGAGVRILDGVTIGEGSVIGAGSVVSRSIPSFSVAVGSPAKVLKSRR